MANKKHLFSWDKYWSTVPISISVEEAAKDTIRILFPSVQAMKPLTKVAAGQFTSTGQIKTCGQITKILTQGGTGYHGLWLTMNTAYVKTTGIVLVHNPTLKGKTTTHTVTNNITS